MAVRDVKTLGDDVLLWAFYFFRGPSCPHYSTRIIFLGTEQDPKFLGVSVVIDSKMADSKMAEDHHKDHIWKVLNHFGEKE